MWYFYDLFTFEQSAVLSANLGCAKCVKVGGELKPIALVARLVASPNSRPTFAPGFLKAFCSSFKWLPAYWIPVSAINRRRMSFVPSKILNIRKSRITRSTPASRMKPIPPKVWIASSHTHHADSDAKHCNRNYSSHYQKGDTFVYSYIIVAAENPRMCKTINFIGSWNWFLNTMWYTNILNLSKNAYKRIFHDSNDISIHCFVYSFILKYR